MPEKQDDVIKTSNARLISLQKPEKLSEVLKQDKYDCLSCRLTGEGLIRAPREPITQSIYRSDGILWLRCLCVLVWEQGIERARTRNHQERSKSWA